MIFPGMNNRCSNLIFYQMHGNQYVRAMPLCVTNPRTPAQMSNRKRFAVLSKWAGVCCAALYQCMGKYSLVVLRRLFISLNMQHTIVDKGMEIRIDWKNVCLLKGLLLPPEVMAERGIQEREICFWRKKGLVQEGSHPYDRVYAVVVDVHCGQAAGYSLGMRSEYGRTSLFLPDAGEWKDIYIFVFVVGHDECAFSPSVCIFPGT